MNKNQQQVARAAALVMVAFAASRLLGLVRQMVFGQYFGTGPDMDAYVAALRIPDAIFFIAAGGALGSAFIPLFTQRLALQQTDQAWRLASAVINILLLVLIPISLLCIVFAPWLVSTLVAPALPPEVQQTTVRLMRVMLLSPTIFGVSGVVMGTLNAHQHFLLPAIAPIAYNLGLIGGAILGGQTGLGTMGPALGMVVGSILHLLIQIPGLVWFRARYVLTLGRGDRGVVEVATLMAPRVLGVAALQINMVVTSNLASRLGLGAISALEYAYHIMMLPQGVFAQAVGTAAFPTFSALAARGEYDELARTLAATLRTLIALTLPATVGMMVLGRPIIALMFQRGEFDASSTLDVAWALGFFAVGLVAYSAIEVLARAFYALHDTWTPALAAVLAVILNVALGLTLPSLFLGWGVPQVGGLALANALAVVVEMFVLIALIYRRIPGAYLAGLLSFSLRVLAASLGMGLLVVGWLQVAPTSVAVQGAVGVGIGVLGYAGIALVLGINELRQALRLVWGRRRFQG